jgi:RES domain-containing protein
MEVFRLIDVQHAGLILDGTSAALTGGRWNPRGSAVIYASRNVSLAILELLSHYRGPFACARYCVATISIPDAELVHLDRERLPPRWQHLPSLTRREGLRWLDSGSSLALAVPSAVHAYDDNVLINPAHRRFPEVRLLSCGPLRIASSIAEMTDQPEDEGIPLSLAARPAEPQA